MLRSDPKSSNPVLSSLNIDSNDRVISVKENSNADSNFILTHLMKQIFYDKNKICLVHLHNTIDHYHNVGKKLGYDLQKYIREKQANTVDLLEELMQKDDYNFTDKEEIVKNLFLTIKDRIEQLFSDNKVYLIIDDLSHLLDLGVEINHVISFINYCNNLTNDERVNVIVNTHVCNSVDEIVANALQYNADVHIEICALKTGRSKDVTGFLNIQRGEMKSCFQYKAFDRGVKTFHPGESIHHLLK